ncbi:hypothetical protein QVD17_39511 [Tagetes erecta]|uniref:Uncharacterized protein n=1 Tax=Tagetes erecta TaxID=13708 RepID=A0AAD8NFC3_TARER|nr:hypothetical protein QVD17_39511 [Tagetes erecta]
MGGVAVVHPQDCFNDNSFVTPVKSRPTPISAGVRRNKTMVTNPPVSKTLVMGQVKILKRGEPLDESSPLLTKNVPVDRKAIKDVSVKGSKKKKNEKRNTTTKSQKLKPEDFALCSTNRLGPDPEMVPKQNLADLFFAGSAFVDSPPPSSLPLPGFFSKNEDPTTDLRRILGLSFP